MLLKKLENVDFDVEFGNDEDDDRQFDEDDESELGVVEDTDKMENVDFDVVESGNDEYDDGQFDEDEMLKMMKNVDVAEDDEDEYFVGTSEGPRGDTREKLAIIEM
ncbi:hypothetical protein ACOSQ2_009853 [Xanthoceras sorbifolium]